MGITVEPFAFLTVQSKCWKSIIARHCSAGYHVLKLFGFLQEVEFFYKPLQYGLKKTLAVLFSYVI